MRREAIDLNLIRRDYFLGRDVPCPACAYNLRNAAGERCPECGTRLALSLAPQTPSPGVWATCVAACAAPLGLAVAFAVPGWINAIAAIGSSQRQWGRSDWINLAIASAVALAALLAIRGLAAWPHCLARSSIAKQRIVAACFVAAGGVTMVALVAAFRMVYGSSF